MRARPGLIVSAGDEEGEGSEFLGKGSVLVTELTNSLTYDRPSLEWMGCWTV